MSTSRDRDPDEPRSEYDFSEGVRGKYTDRFDEDAKVVVLDPDVAAAFPTPESVNEALRWVLALKKRNERANDPS